MKVTRTIAAGGLVTAMILSLNSVAAAHGGPSWEDESLAGLGMRSDLRIGTAVDMDAFASDTTYRERIATEFSSVTAENVMKWETLEPEPGVRNYGPADELVDFARQNRQLVRGHVLVWHNQLPGWLTDGVASGEITPAELRGILRTHIIETVRHFRGKVWQWDVANEVIDDDGNLRDSIWLQNLGPGYIADAFRWANQADRRVRLYLNDYNIEGFSAKSDAYYALVQQLLADRVPIDGLGVQGHLGVQFGFWDANSVAANLGRFEELGLDTAITEADVRMVMPPDNPKLQGQANGYNTLLQGCLLASRCDSFTVWGYTDKYSWVPGFFEGEGAANLLDEQFSPKPAYQAAIATLRLAAGKRGGGHHR
jgi:endo-1,4-beta-xylanase